MSEFLPDAKCGVKLLYCMFLHGIQVLPNLKVAKGTRNTRQFFCIKYSIQHCGDITFLYSRQGSVTTQNSFFFVLILQEKTKVLFLFFLDTNIKLRASSSRKKIDYFKLSLTSSMNYFFYLISLKGMALLYCG